MDNLKEDVKNKIDKISNELINISLTIHNNPELGFHEKKASSLLINFLDSKGFKVKKNIANIPTAFKASYGRGNPKIALLAEYDALPKIGHACGHNIIAAIAVGAGIASKRAIDNLGGTIVVLGTPAEEISGAKIYMVEAGIFKDIDVAMMIHPSTVVDVGAINTLNSIALNIEFIGKSAHAAVRPSEGLNALEALILSFNSINSLRQRLKKDTLIHGIITNGGEAANIIPDYSAGRFIIRSLDIKYLEKLKKEVLNCFIGASIATGTKLNYKWREYTYLSMKNNMFLVNFFKKNMEELGRHVKIYSNISDFGGTDMGNVSREVPSIHPLISIASQHITPHSLEFASSASSKKSYKAILDGSKALAMTVIDIISKNKNLIMIKKEFNKPD